MPTVAKRLYTIAEVMEMTGMGRTFIYELIRRGVLITVPMKRATRIKADSVEALISGGIKF